MTAKETLSMLQAQVAGRIKQRLIPPIVYMISEHIMDQLPVIWPNPPAIKFQHGKMATLLSLLKYGKH